MSEDGGHWYPPATAYPSGAPDGTSIAWLNNDTPLPSATYSQVLGSTLEQGTYTLRAKVGQRLAGTAYAGYDIQLLAGGVPLVTETDVLSGITPALGTFSDVELSFVAPSGHAQLGQPLEIFFTSRSIGAQTNFDDFSLDFQAALAPEPSTFLLFAMAVLAIVAVHWWRRRSRRAWQHSGR